MKRTIAEIADVLGVDRDAAAGLVKFMTATKPPMAQFRGERPNRGGIGRGAFVYEVGAGSSRRVASLIERLED